MATVQIKVADEDFTARVVFSTASFESAVNGATGPCKFRIRDDNRDITLATGSIIELLIDGDPVWTGYLTLVSRVYAFPAENVSDAGLTRWFDVEGTDLNTLLTKRIVVRESDPENVYGKLYGPGTPDDEAVGDLVTDFLDLSGDDLDVSTMVENVADINVDQKARAWSSGYTWGQAMASIAMLPAAVYFLDPSRQLVYTDVNTPNAALGLSDQPGAGQASYREMVILKDGSALANDVLAWGLGYGSPIPVFVRDEDAASQAEHGLWQVGTVRSGIYKQATIDRVAESIIDGSPSSKRGAKNDRVAVSLVTYQAGFLPAQKVEFESNIFGFSDVIPIRKMKVTFPTPEDPRYELLLSHAIDDPWSFFDPFIFNLSLPPFPRLPPFPFPPRLGCGITDGYGRYLPTSAGVSDAGILYIESNGNAPSPSGLSYAVVGDGLVITANDVSVEFGSIDLPLPVGEFEATFIIRGYPAGDLAGSVGLQTPGIDATASVSFTPASGGLFRAFDDGANDTTPFDFDGSPFMVRVRYSLAGTQGKIWYTSGPEPADWMVSRPAGSRALAPAIGFEFDGFSNDGDSVKVQQLNVWSRADTGAALPLSVFDDFNRTETDEWGNATPSGEPWTYNGVTAYQEANVAGAKGRLWIAPSGGSAEEGNNILSVPVPLGLIRPFGIAFKVQFVTLSETSNSFWASGENLSPGVLFFLEGDSGDVTVDFTLGDTAIDDDAQTVELSSAGTVDPYQEFFDWVHSTAAWYNVELQVRLTTVEVRLWLVGADRPLAATFVLSTPSAEAFLGDLTFGIQQRQATGSSPDLIIPEFEVWVREIAFSSGVGTLINRCYPFPDVVIIDDFENRTVSNAWDTPSRGAPDWIDFDSGVVVGGSSTSAISVSTGFGRIDLQIIKGSAGSPAIGAFHQMQLEVSEIEDPDTSVWDDFILEFDMIVAPLTEKQGIAIAQIILGGQNDDPVAFPKLDLVFQFEHVAAGTDHLDWNLARDAIGGIENVRNDQIAAVNSFDGHITVDRNVARGSTLVTVGAHGTYEFSPISPYGTDGFPSPFLYVSYSDTTSDVTNDPSHFSIDNIKLTRR